MIILYIFLFFIVGLLFFFIILFIIRTKNFSRTEIHIKISILKNLFLEYDIKTKDESSNSNDKKNNN